MTTRDIIVETRVAGALFRTKIREKIAPYKGQIYYRLKPNTAQWQVAAAVWLERDHYELSSWTDIQQLNSTGLVELGFGI